MTPTDAPATPTNPFGAARRDYQVFRRLVIALLVVASAGPLALNIVDPDLWGHVRYAEEWIADGELPRTATHTFTAEGHPWVNHENLAEWLLARGFRTLGVQGMLAAKVVLGMGILLLMSLVASRQGARPIAAWACFLLVAHNLHAFFPLRPQLLSFLWCSVMLLMLDRAFAGWGNRRSDFRHSRRKADPTAVDWRWLYGMPVLFVVWANSHGGFVAGMAILVAVVGGRCIELIARQLPGTRKTVLGLATVVGASALVTLLNPYGVGLHAWLVSSLGAARPEITEWGPPTLGNPVFWPFAMLVAAAIAAFVFTDRRRDPVKIIVLALIGWQAATHLRHIAFFALLCGFWLPPHLQSIATRLRQRASEGLPTASLSGRMRIGIAAALAGAIALQATFLGQRLASFPVYRSRYPVDAIQWMADQRVRGDLLVCFNWAQYAIAALAPDVRVAFDGRFRTCYPQSVIDRHFDFLVGDLAPRSRADNSGPIDGSKALTEDQPDYVLVDRKYKNAVRVMAEATVAESSDWTLVYQDAVSQLWGRTAIVDDADSPQYVPNERRFVSDHFSLTAIDWPALPRERDVIAEQQVPNEVAARSDSQTSKLSNEG